jgi:UDP-N-acetylglucosamine 1-carboxyvinyltransferase
MKKLVDSEPDSRGPRLLVSGGRRLAGRVSISGAKNAALPLLASSLLAPGRSTYRNLPDVRDVETMRRLLAALGARVSGRATTSVDATTMAGREAPYEVVQAMRASILVLAPLLARFGHARVAMPGGCAIGPRPIDQHLRGLAALGAKITLERGVLSACALRLHGAAFVFDVVSVTGTETLMMAAARARGRTLLENAACEPEIEELAGALNRMGARVEGAGTSVVFVEGVDELHPIEHSVMPDRIEAGTLMIAAALTRGDVLLEGCVPEHLDAVVAKLRAAGAQVTASAEGLRVRGGREISPADVATRPHPGFPTDLQAQFMVLMTRAAGQSMLTETVFESRFAHVAELARMGADIVIEGRSAIVRGPRRLGGAKVVASDLRASASLVLAGLIAEGTTEVLRAHHLERGYERLDKKLRALGAEIRRETRAT